MRKAGVSDNVIQAIVAAQAQANPSGPTGSQEDAQKITGIWKGSVTRGNEAYDAKLVLSQQGTNLTGNLTIYGFHGIDWQFNITTGLLQGAEFSVSGLSQRAGGTVGMDLSGNLQANTIRGKLDLHVSSIAGGGTEAYSFEAYPAHLASYPAAGQPAKVAPTAPASVAASCIDYNSCVTSGRAALDSSQWNDATAAWDKALSLGGPLALVVCHEITFGCEQGTISLGAKEISFARSGRKLFAVLPSQVTPIGIVNEPSIALRVAFRLKIDGKNYNFDFLPTGVTCQIPGRLLQCPEQAVAQQLAVANYIIATLKLGIPSAEPAAAPSVSTPASSPNPAPCSEATDLGYSLLVADHLYKVKRIAPASGGHVHVFFDEKGSPVQDQNLLQKLALGAWTKELIVDRYNPSSGSGSTGVKAALYTFGSLQGWQDATDLLARATVESLAAVVTAGVSVETVQTRLVWGVVQEQFTDPKRALAHWVRGGLEQSLADYTQMEGLMRGLGPTEFKLSDLEKTESLYTAANTLASVNQALGAALAPTTWQDEFTQYLRSAISELVPQPGLKSNALLRLSDVLKLEQSVAGTGETFAAYKQSLEQALKVSQSNQQVISAWAADATRGCR